MAEIIDISKYKLKKSNIISSKLNEENLANQILDSLNYNNQNIAIPIVKIAKAHGLEVYRENFYKSEELNVAGKLFIGGATRELYDCNQVILVNRNDHIFDQRIAVARLLGYYLTKIANKTSYNNSSKKLLSDILNYGKLYDKYEEFILNILAPSQIFVRQYNIAVDSGFHRMDVYMYLSRYFEVSDEFVQRKVKSLTRV